jgi:hypothetical protein
MRAMACQSELTVLMCVLHLCNMLMMLACTIQMSALRMHLAGCLAKMRIGTPMPAMACQSELTVPDLLLQQCCACSINVLLVNLGGRSNV